MKLSGVYLDSRTLHRRTPDYCFTVCKGSVVEVRRYHSEDEATIERNRLLDLTPIAKIG